MKKIFIIFIVLLLSEFKVNASNRESIPIELIPKVEFSPSPRLPDEGKNGPEHAILLEYTLEIRNIGEAPVKLPTCRFLQSTDSYENCKKTNINWKINNDGKWVTIIPETEYGFVILRPMERVYIHWKEIEFYEKRLKTINIIFQVSKDFASRYGCWSGILRATCSGEPKKILFDYRENKVDN